MKILAIETSCDETSAAVVVASPGDRTVRLLSNVVASSLAFHAKTGGIIPEVAAREQVKYIIPVIKQALKESKLPSIDAIAVTYGPGLIGSLLVGVETAKTLAYIWKRPIIPVNHLVGHVYANWISKSTDYSLQTTVKPQQDKKAVDRRQWTVDNINFPALALIVSGGHTDLVVMKDHEKLSWIGGTRDDAAGEAFDKIGRLLGLAYPAGPVIAAEAAKIQNARKNSEEFSGQAKFKMQNFHLFPRPMIDSNDFDFSFSGLKTAALREIQKRQPLTEKDKQELSAQVQQAIVDVLVAKTIKAAAKHKVKSILISGGVAANDLLRQELAVRSQKLGVNFFAPQKNLCTDNAAMIGAAACFNLQKTDWSQVTTNPALHF